MKRFSILVLIAIFWVQSIVPLHNAFAECGGVEIFPMNSGGSGGGPVEGTDVLSTGETGGVLFLREDGDGTSSWQAPAGGGDVTAAVNLGDNLLIRGDGVTKGIKNSNITVGSDSITGDGQLSVIGGIDAGDDILLQSTSNATKGSIGIGSLTTGLIYDGVSARLSLGQNTNTITINTTSIGSKFTVNAEGASDLLDVLQHRHSDTPAFGTAIAFARSRGTHAAEAAVQDNDILSRLNFYGFDGTDYEIAAQIDCEIDGTVGADQMGGALTFGTTADGTNSAVERMRIDNDGNVGIGTVSPSTPLHVDSNAANAAAITTFENTAGDFQIFRSDATPEGAITGNIDDLCVEEGELWIKHDGMATNTEWQALSRNVAAFSSMWYHGPADETTINNVGIFEKVTTFENVGHEDSFGNVVSDPTTDDDITANIAGSYTGELGASFSNTGGANKFFLLTIGLDFSTPKVITGATNATPIVIISAGHGFLNGDMGTISGVGGNTAANTDFFAANVTTDTFEMQTLNHVDIAGNGAYTSGGTIDTKYSGEGCIDGAVNQASLARGYGSALGPLSAGDAISVYIANLTDTVNLELTQITVKIGRLGD